MGQPASHPDTSDESASTLPAGYSRAIEDWRAEEFGRLQDTVYLDHAGAALYPESLVRNHCQHLLSGLHLNPHSSHAAEQAIDTARRQLLTFFGAASDEYSLVFTSGATESLRVVAEGFAFGPGSVFAYPVESHTSVVGMRQYAFRHGARVATYEMDRLADVADPSYIGRRSIEPPSPSPSPPPSQCPHEAFSSAPPPPNLLIVTGESNFSGLKGDLSLLPSLMEPAIPHHQLHYRVLLDASKLAASSRIDLSRTPVDFMVFSLYKVFGYPTGLGGLIVRHSAAPLLSPPSFGGGTVQAVAATSAFVAEKAALCDRLEAGSPHFLGIAAVPMAFEAVFRRFSMEQLEQHMQAVTHYAYQRMAALTWRQGGRVFRIFGDHHKEDWPRRQGPVVACVVLSPTGDVLPYSSVAGKARERGIVFRTGCHCNTGGCQTHLQLTAADLERHFMSGHVCGDDVDTIDGQPTGCIRLSFGFSSTLADVDRFIDFIRQDVMNEPDTPAPAPQCSLRQDGPVTPPALPPASTPSPPADGHHAAEGVLSSLCIYPIKSCGGVSLARWVIDLRTGGLLLDRRFRLERTTSAEKMPRVISRTSEPKLAQLRVALECDVDRLVMVLSFADEGRSESSLRIPIALRGRPSALLSVIRLMVHHQDSESGTGVGADGEGDEAVARWFGDRLGYGVRLVDSEGDSDIGGEGGGDGRRLLSNYANTSPFLLVSSSSLDHLQRTSGLSIMEADRFRGNLIVSGLPPLIENSWADSPDIPVHIGNLDFYSLGSCKRCPSINVDPQTGTVTASVLQSLTTITQGMEDGSGRKRGVGRFGVLLRYGSSPHGGGDGDGWVEMRAGDKVVRAGSQVDGVCV
ncbi:unnamed protein product [Vitrella brassicaformis CCMP3155]|uniref:MOSC domain-containing protein n=1 Tax=Vitrella brassicaformis (strain CCMP3155) TaxID=1169540 RepID=A0A0G4FUB8_VITBC|nr:unnamed protein product [Vitrella brassicaformis CCMP3155]|eukprot:CEM18312.1 unnamed protein product [Vitrella brassicaformis CCMP3155]